MVKINAMLKETARNHIIYRVLRKKDYPGILEMIDSTWNFDKYTADRSTKTHMLKAYMRAVMIVQNYTQVAELDGKAIGLLFGKIPKLKGFMKNWVHIPPAVYHTLCLIFGKQQRRVLKGFKDLQAVYARLRKETKMRFDGELEFFVVNHQYQGLDVGKQLLNNYLQYCERHGVKNIYVYTDANSNFGFYDHHGFVRRGCLPASFELYSGKLEYDNFIYTREIP
ncbi:MAG: GNAT family N-acetyltransferase [Smithella sp.]|nr:GNAT family N-acetyltransferase [Smithella sp.]